MRDGARCCTDDLVTDSSASRPASLQRSPSTSVQARRRGRGLREASVVVEREFHTATVHQGYIEPHNATALVERDGSVTVWSSTQGAFTVRAQVAELLEPAGVARQGGADGDRRRLRRQDPLYLERWPRS